MNRIWIQDDFDPEKIADSGQCFRCRREPDGSWEFIAGSRCIRIQSLTEGCFGISCDEETWHTVWHPYFDLDRNYAQLRSGARGYFPYLDHALDTGAGLRILRQDPWETLVTFILSQRRSIPVIQRCVNLLCDAFGTSAGSFSVFPAPDSLAQAGEDMLRACSLGYRAPYVRKTAEMVARGDFSLQFSESLSTPDLIGRLTELPGVGIKVASCVALFAYGRMDAAPVDTWIARVIREDFHGCSPFECFPETAGIIQQYLFYSKRYDSSRLASSSPARSERN